MVALIFPLLYSKAIKEALTAATSVNHLARAYSYQDDLDIVHHPNCTVQTSTSFHSACSRIGLRANTSKETITPGRSVPPRPYPPTTPWTTTQRSSSMDRGPSQPSQARKPSQAHSSHSTPQR